MTAWDQSSPEWLTGMSCMEAMFEARRDGDLNALVFWRDLAGCLFRDHRKKGTVG